MWHGIKGARNSPKGDKLLGSISAIKARAPVVGGNFGVWGGLFSTFDCAVKGYRQKEDPYNAIISGFLTGGTLAVRSERPVQTPVSSGGVTLVNDRELTCVLRLNSGTERNARISHWVRYPAGCVRGCRCARGSVRAQACVGAGPEALPLTSIPITMQSVCRDQQARVTISKHLRAWSWHRPTADPSLTPSCSCQKYAPSCTGYHSLV